MTKKRIEKALFFIIILSMAIILGKDVKATSDFKIQNKDGVSTLVEYTGDAKIVTVPNGVECIENRAFEGKKKMIEVKLPDTVQVIGAYAFNECTSLKEIKLSKNLKAINNGAFRKCKKLSMVKLNSKLKSIDEFVFAGCSGLKKITIPKKNKKFVLKKGVLYSKNMKRLIVYPASLKKMKKFIISSSVKAVEACAFSNNKYLEKIIVKGKISAGESSFKNCKSLKTVIFEKPYKSGVDLSNCKKLTTVVLAEGTKYIGESQFDNCISLKNINFPSSLKGIDMYAFYGCKNLKVPVLTSTIEVDRRAFEGCAN